MLGVKSRSSGKQPVLLTIELSVSSPPGTIFHTDFYYLTHGHCHSGPHSPPQIASRPSIFGCTYPFPIQKPHSLLCHVHYCLQDRIKTRCCHAQTPACLSKFICAVLMSCCAQQPRLPRVPLDDSALLPLISSLYLQTIPGPVRGRYLINLK